MERRRPLIALLLALTLVGQGVAFAQSSAALPAPPATADATLPCHDAAPLAQSCCDQASSCPDMLICLTGHAAASSLTLVLPDARDDLNARGAASRPATSRPPTVFRPPIVISA